MLRYEAIQVNSTLGFSVSLAVLAAKAGALLSVGWLNDLKQNGMELIRVISETYGQYKPSLQAKILRLRAKSTSCC